MVQLFLSCIITGSIMSFVGLTMLVCLLVKGWRTKTLSQFKAMIGNLCLAVLVGFWCLV